MESSQRAASENRQIDRQAGRLLGSSCPQVAQGRAAHPGSDRLFVRGREQAERLGAIASLLARCRAIKISTSLGTTLSAVSKPTTTRRSNRNSISSPQPRSHKTRQVLHTRKDFRAAPRVRPALAASVSTEMRPPPLHPASSDCGKRWRIAARTAKQFRRVTAPQFGPSRSAGVELFGLFFSK